MNGKRRGDESGMTLVEVIVASAISLIVLLAVSSTVQIAGDATTKTLRQGSSLPSTLFAAQDAERTLASAWNPYLGPVSGVTNDCATSSNPATSSLFSDSGGSSGAFVSPAGWASNEVQFCGFAPGASRSYTYDLYLGPTKGCTSSCTLMLVQWPCSTNWETSCPTGVTGTSSVKWALKGLSQGPKNGAAFIYRYESGGSWTTQASPTSATQVVELDLQGVYSSTAGPEVVRDAVLPTSLKGMS